MNKKFENPDLKHGPSTWAISAFRRVIATILEIGGRFYLFGEAIFELPILLTTEQMITE